MPDRIDVYFENVRVAAIAGEPGNPVLTYDTSWRLRNGAFPISLSMPLDRPRHGGEAIMPWLANLLPENHLAEIGQMMGVHGTDVVAILSRMGRDTAGALSFGAPRGTGGRNVPIGDEAALEKIIDDLPARPFLVGTQGVSMSLAGAQDKIAVSLVDGRVSIPVEGMPSTHILKPDIPKLKGSVQNEAFCLTLAAMCGLEAAKVDTGRAGKRSYLLVERFDRVLDARGAVRRVHSEDLAQVLGFYPVQKYEVPPDGSLAGRGPDLKAMFAAVAGAASPGERLRLLDAVIFNVLACNTDSHAKNYSLMIGAGGRARLAPIYDVLCGEVWPSITKNMAQRIGDKTVAAQLHAADWRKLAAQVGLNPTATVRRVEDLCALVREHAPAARDRTAAMPAGGTRILDSALHEVLKRTRRIEAQLSEAPRPSPRTPGVPSGDEPPSGPAPR